MSTNIKTTIQINADINAFEQSLNSVAKKLGSLNAPPNLASSFKQEFDAIKRQIAELRLYTENNELSLVDKKKVESTLEGLESSYKRLVKSLSDEKLGDLISKEDAVRLSKITELLGNYKEQVGKVLTQVQKLEQKQKIAQAEKEIALKKEQELRNKIALEAEKQAEVDDLKKRVEAAKQAKDSRLSSDPKYTSEDSVGFNRTKEYKEWSRLQRELIAQENELKTIQEEIGKSPSMDEVSKSARQAEKSYEKATTAVSAYKEQIANPAIAQASKEMGSSFEQLGLTVPTTAEELRKLEYELQKEEQAAINNAMGIRDMSNELRQCSTAQQDIRTKTNEASVALEKQNDATQKLNGFVARIKQFTGLTGAMMVFRKAARTAYNAIKELDEQMTQMAVVTNQSVGDYWKQMPEHTKRANALGVSIKEVYEAETLYYQQGLKAQQVQEVSNVTLKMARIAGLDAAEATNKMTAALRGFNMEVNETNAERVADVYSQLAAITASTVEEISTAMTKTASIADSAGMEFEKTAAFLSQIIETTRESAETAGTAMKTVIARFQELKKDPSEIGEIDGEIVDANKIETALRSVGVALRDTSGQFRDLDDVFMELAQKWDGLDTNTQRYIATIAAGSRQQSRFIAMMSDYGRTTELVAAAQDSAGASAAQFEKTLDSLQNRTNQLSSAWTEFTTGLMNSEFIKGAVTALTGILNVLNDITSSSNSTVNSLLKIGLIIGIAYLASSAITIFSATFKKTMEDNKNAVAKGTSTSSAFFASLKAVGTSAAEAIKRKFYELKNSMQIIFKKKNVIKIDSSQALQANIAATKLRLTQHQLAKTELELKQIDQQLENQTISEAKAESSRNAIMVRRKQLTDMQKKSESQLIALGLTKEEVENLNNISESTGITISEARILTNHGYTASEIEAMGAEKAKLVADKLSNACGLRSWAITKLRAKALEWEKGGFIKAFFAEKMKIIADALAEKSAWKLAAAIWATVWPLLAIAAAIALVVGLVMLIIAAVKEAKANSPEGRLKRDKERLKEAADAAKAAADSYSELCDSLDSLKEKEEALETLTKGTEEWEKALEEINNQVLELLDKYPDLAKYTTFEDGHLKLDEEGVKEYKKAQKRVVQSTRIGQRTMEVQVAHSNANVKRSDLLNNLSNKNKSIIEKNEASIMNLAQALKSAEYAPTFGDGATAGEIKDFLAEQGFTDASDEFCKALEDSQGYLVRWGTSLDELSAQNKVLATQVADIVADDLNLNQKEKAAYTEGITKIAAAHTKEISDQARALTENYNSEKWSAGKMFRAGAETTLLGTIGYSIADSVKEATDFWEGANNVLSAIGGWFKKRINPFSLVTDNPGTAMITYSIEAAIKHDQQKKQTTKDTFLAAGKYGEGITENSSEADILAAGKEKYREWAATYFNDNAVTVDDYGTVYDRKGDKLGDIQTNLQKFATESILKDKTEKISEIYTNMLKQVGDSSLALSDTSAMSNKEKRLLAEKSKAALGKDQSKWTGDQRDAYTVLLEQITEVSVKDAAKDLKTKLDLSKYADVLSNSLVTGINNSLKDKSITPSERDSIIETVLSNLNQINDPEILKQVQSDLYSFNWQDSYGWENFLDKVRKYAGDENIVWEEFINTMIDQTHALHRLTIDEANSMVQTVKEVKEELNKAGSNANISAENWEKLSKVLTGDLKKSFVQLTDGTYQFIGAANELANILDKSAKMLLEEASNALDQKVEESIQASRDLEEEKQRKEKAFDNYGIRNTIQQEMQSRGYWSPSFISKIVSEIEQEFNDLDITDTEATEAFKKRYGSYGIDLDEIFNYVDTRDQSKYKNYLEERQQLYTIQGQQLNSSELNEVILSTQDKNAGQYTSERDREERQAELAGLVDAKIAIAAKAGVDPRLITAFTEAYEKAEKAKKSYDDISPTSLTTKTSEEKKYNIAKSEEEQALVALNKAIFEASSSLSTVNVATNTLKRSQDALAITQEKYQKLIINSSASVADLADNLKQQKDQLANIIKSSGDLVEKQQAKIDEKVASLKERYKEYGEDLIQFDKESNTYYLNNKNAQKIFEEDKENALVKAIEELNEDQTNLNDTNKANQEAEEQLKTINQNQREAMGAALDKITPLLEKSRQSQIEELENINTTINDVQSAILSSMKESIEMERQIRDNTQKEQDINDKEARLAYLMADSSGANATEIATLQKEISDARQEQSDELVDQSLDSLEKANSEAAEQRQQQIDLLKEQLDLDKERDLRAQAFEMLQTGALDSFDDFKNSKFAQLVKDNDDKYQNLSKTEQEKYLEDLFNTLKQGALGIQSLNLTHYATGGLSTTTGPAWLDGTPAEPELILNSADTKNFLILKDALTDFMNNHTNLGGAKNNDVSKTTYVDVNINVDSLTSDYDVNEVARQVQDYITEDALYRNSTMVTNRR